jgi:hypothetical protein
MANIIYEVVKTTKDNNAILTQDNNAIVLNWKFPEHSDGMESNLFSIP